ncbi:hypothetical protein SAMN04487904_1184 [Actinopolyspora lacussalsi subsp. righensis]|uniref:Uncharacterized protein n=1 Tax=Actinopolyspora righensis TaxID=995060 RepID=A0A1I7CE19_9ACTN|nr:hypothetical protein [Actinopolyspora righensis]SFT97656.1 hypothetical protein SAMN04487904_1184 [Actinopolyspora righensis]
MRIYLPATVRMLREFFEQQQLRPLSGTAFALTPALRESYSSGDAEELEYAAMREAARASLRLISTELGDSREAETEESPRRVVVSADVRDEEATLRPDLDHAVVRLANPVPWKKIAAVHVDTAEAEEAVRQAAQLIDDADLGEEKAELALGDAEDHELAWFAPQEVPFMLELM